MRRLAATLAVVASLGVSSVASAAKNPYIPQKLVKGFACIMWHESRSTFAKPNLKDNNRYGQSGVFQIAPITWNRWAPLAGVFVPVWQATYFQQSKVAVKIQQMDGWSPWKFDGCKIF